MQSYLKVKVCALAAESKAIKVQQRRWKKAAARARAREKNPAFAEANYFGLRQHRVGKEGVRAELRDSNLAYGFLRGRNYEAMESFAFTKPNWDNIEKMVKKFGGDVLGGILNDNRDLMQRFSGWKDAATQHYERREAIERRTTAPVKGPHLPGTMRPEAGPTPPRELG